MEVMKSIDVEDVVREALSASINEVYVRPLPSSYKVPCLLIQQVGGTELNTIDTFDVSIDARAELAGEASELLRTAIAVLKAKAKEQSTAIRYVEVNSLGNWGVDPVRPDLAMMTARVRVVVHQQKINMEE